MLTVRDIEKYRRRHPAPELSVPGECRRFVVIPCYNENGTVFSVLDSLEAASKPYPVTVAAVVNYPKGADGTLSWEILPLLQDRGVVTLFLPELEGGVGRARRLGMDGVLAQIPPEELSKSLIFSLDGDSPVEPDYFETIEAFAASCPETGAFTVGFEHLPGETPEEERAIRRYEAYLHRYVEKLKDANSPYAFHTIGSCFAVRGDAYIRSGGMKEKAAGEDFYFLQELAKCAGVLEIPKVLVHPSSRCSYRVPFGTGKAVEQLVSGGTLPEISDQAFVRLKTVLDAVSPGLLACDTPEFPEKEFFIQEKFFNLWPGIRKNTPSPKLTRAFHTWFDGLKTLRFLHFCDA